MKKMITAQTQNDNPQNIRLSVGNFKRLAKVAAIMQLDPEEVLNSLVCCSMESPTGLFDIIHDADTLDELTAEERAQYDALRELDADGWKADPLA